MSVNRPVDGGWQFVSSVYVADDALLAVYGLDATDIPPDADVLTVDDGPLALIGAPKRRAHRTRDIDRDPQPAPTRSARFPALW